MSSRRFGACRRLRLGVVTALSILLLLALTPLLGACGGAEPTAEVLIVTATFTSLPIAQGPTVTLAPTREEVPTTTTLASPPPPGPTVTLAPPVDPQASATPEPAGTEAPAPAATATTTPKPQPKAPALNSLMDDVQQARASIDKLEKMGVKTIYPGHGAPFTMETLLSHLDPG